MPALSARSPKKSSTKDSFTITAWVKPEAETPLFPEKSSGILGFSARRNGLLYPPPGHEVYGEGHAGAGFSVGTNGVCLFEHSVNYFAPLLVYTSPIKGLNHVAMVYIKKQPKPYLNGKSVKKALKSSYVVHPGVGVIHTRQVMPFRGEVSGLRFFPSPLNPEEIKSLPGKGRPRCHSSNLLR